jgi:hypothetical protein
MNPKQYPLLLYDSTAAAMECMLYQLCLDDCLTRYGWRLDYIYPERGNAFYALYRRGVLLGIVDVMAYRRGMEVDRKMGVYLAGMGFTPHNTWVVIGGAKTPIDIKKDSLPQLFYAPSNRSKKYASPLWA